MAFCEVAICLIDFRTMFFMTIVMANCSINVVVTNVTSEIQCGHLD
jgi:hypothetical protein